MIRTNIAIRTKSSDLVDFFYPNFTRMSEFSPFIDGGVIFDGDSKYLQMFRDSNIKYIYVKGTPEYDLTIPENLLTFVFDKWDKKPTNSLIDYFNQYDKVNDELENIAKQIWVTGKYTIIDEDEKRMDKLYSLFARGSSYDLMKEFLSLSSDISLERLFYCVQWFLKRTKDTSSIKSVKMRNNVESFKSIRGKNIQPALMGYLYSPADSIELKLLKLFDMITVINRK